MKAQLLLATVRWAQQISRDLKQGLANSDVAVSTVYTDPTAFSLANTISDLSVLSRQVQVCDEQTRWQVMDVTFQEHTFQVWLDRVRADAEVAGSADVDAMLRANPEAKLLGS